MVTCLVVKRGLRRVYICSQDIAHRRVGFARQDTVIDHPRARNVLFINQLKRDYPPIGGLQQVKASYTWQSLVLTSIFLITFRFTNSAWLCVGNKMKTCTQRWVPRASWGKLMLPRVTRLSEPVWVEWRSVRQRGLDLPRGLPCLHIKTNNFS